MFLILAVPQIWGGGLVMVIGREDCGGTAELYPGLNCKKERQNKLCNQDPCPPPLWFLLGL